MIKHCMRDQNVAEKDTLVTVEVYQCIFKHYTCSHKIVGSSLLGAFDTFDLSVLAATACLNDVGLVMLLYYNVSQS